MRPWVTKFSGVLYDRRWLPVVERIYHWHFDARALPAQRGAAGPGGAALLASRPPRSPRRRPTAIAPRTTCSGMYQALVEARVPFEMVHEALLTPDRLDRLQAADPAERRGAVGRAVRRDPRVRRRAAAAWWRRSRRRSTTRSGGAARTSAWPTCSASRSPAASTGRCRTRTCASRPTRRPDAGTRCSTASTTRRGSSTASSGSTSRRRREFPSPLTLIPTYPDLPMEDVYPRVPQTDDARGLPARARRQPRRLLPLGHRPHVLGRAGVDHGRLLAERRAWATNEPPPVEVDGPGRARRDDLAAARAR